MLSDPDSARIVDGIGNSAWHRTNRCFTEALCSKKPTRLQAINKDVGLIIWNIHDCRNPIRQKAHTVVTGSRKLSIVRKWIRRHLEALHERPMHVGFTNQGVDDQTG